MIKLIGVKKHYENFNLNCTMQIEKGKVTGLVGRNGSGKSTIFKAILNLINIDDGFIEVFPNDYYRNFVEKKKNIGVAFNYSGFSESLTINKIANIMQPMYSQFNKSEFIDQCMQFKLPPNKKIKDFSTGMKTKLKILIATSYNAKLLLLDEPTTGLDVIARDEILNLLRTYMLPGNRSILISSHIASDLESLCDDIYLIDDGSIIFHENIDTLLEQYGILKLDDKQFNEIDKEYLMKINRKKYGFICLTKEKQFYQENYKNIIIEKCSIDMLMHMIAGELEEFDDTEHLIDNKRREI